MEVPATNDKHRYAVRYAIDGDLRFISHHDTIRLFERALARAAVPVRFSEGFNPRPRISLPVPRPVGVASDDDLLILETSVAMQPDELLSRLSPQVPSGLTLLDINVLAPGERRIPCGATYSMELDSGVVQELERRLETLRERERIEVTRRDHRTGQTRLINLRPWLLQWHLDQTRLEWTQAILQDGTARPAEVLEAFVLPSRDLLHRIRRVSVRYAD